MKKAKELRDDLLNNGIDLDNPDHVEWLYEWAQRREGIYNTLKSSHKELIEALEMAQITMNETIHRTQTGLRRNRLTEENILILTTLAKAKALWLHSTIQNLTQSYQYQNGQ